MSSKKLDPNPVLGFLRQFNAKIDRDGIVGRQAMIGVGKFCLLVAKERVDACTIRQMQYDLREGGFLKLEGLAPDNWNEKADNALIGFLRFHLRSKAETPVAEEVLTGAVGMVTVE